MCYNLSIVVHLKKILKPSTGKGGKMKYIPTLKNSAYKGGSVPEILRIFMEDFSKLAKTDDDVNFYLDPICMKIEEYLLLIDETDDNINPCVLKMTSHAQNLKSTFKQNGFNHFDLKMRRKSLTSLFNKINKVMRDGKSIDSINDLIGIEITLHTKTDYDTEETIDELYKISNLTLEYFSNSNAHKGNKTSLCDASPLKEAISSEHMSDEIKVLKKLNPKICIPKESKIDRRFKNFIKDYVFQPKLKRAYQGVQFVVKGENGIYFEIQIKTQPMRDYLDDEDSPGNHRNHKNGQKNRNIDDLDCIQFDLDFEPEKMNHIYGYRPNIQFDRSGIIQAIKWDLRKSTHN